MKSIFKRAVIREFGRVDEFQITVTTLHEMDHLEVQIEVASDNDAEHMRTRRTGDLPCALVAADSHRSETGRALAFFELKARRFQRPQRTYENQQS